MAWRGNYSDTGCCKTHNSELAHRVRDGENPVDLGKLERNRLIYLDEQGVADERAVIITKHITYARDLQEVDNGYTIN